MPDISAVAYPQPVDFKYKNDIIAPCDPFDFVMVGRYPRYAYAVPLVFPRLVKMKKRPPDP